MHNSSVLTTEYIRACQIKASIQWLITSVMLAFAASCIPVEGQW